MNLELSILIVTYNNAALVDRFHRELTDSLAPHDQWELLYHDNSPDERVCQVLQDADVEPAVVLRAPDNPGFAYGINRLIERSTKPWLLLLNPDVFGFSPDFWAGLIARRQPGRARFIKLRNEDGSMQDCVGRTVSLRRALSKRPNYDGYIEPTPVETGIMAFMLVDRTTLDQVGMLDEDFPLYAEDMDWCYRARAAGIELIFDPTLELTHIGGASATTVANSQTQLLDKLSAERIFINKHYSGPHRLCMLALNRLKQARARR